MKELIERLEKATGPDRAIDLEIARLQGVTVMRRNADDTGNEEYTYHRYTESIDSALTLLPDEDHHWKAGYSKHVRHNAEVRDLMHPHKGVFIGEHDHSRAIALCIAALKARIS